MELPSNDLSQKYVCSDILNAFSVIERLQDMALEYGNNYRIKAEIKLLETGSWYLNVHITDKDEEEGLRQCTMLQPM